MDQTELQCGRAEGKLAMTKCEILDRDRVVLEFVRVYGSVALLDIFWFFTFCLVSSL